MRWLKVIYIIIVYEITRSWHQRVIFFPQAQEYIIPRDLCTSVAAKGSPKYSQMCDAMLDVVDNFAPEPSFN